MLRCKQCFKKKKVWKYTAHEWFQNHDTWISHPFLWFGCVYWIPMSNFEHPMQLSKALHRQLCLPKLFQQGFCPSQGAPMHFVGWTPNPHVGIPMMLNKILKLKCTNKGRLTCSIFCAWAWSSSHSNFTFFFTISRAFFSLCFCLACKLLKIRAFIAWWFCCLGPPTWVEGWPYLPTSMWSPCLLSKC